MLCRIGPTPVSLYHLLHHRRGVEIGDAGAFEIAEVDDIIDVLKGVHIAPGHVCFVDDGGVDQVVGHFWEGERRWGVIKARTNSHLRSLRNCTSNLIPKAVAPAGYMGRFLLAQATLAISRCAQG